MSRVAPRALLATPSLDSPPYLAADKRSNIVEVTIPSGMEIDKDTIQAKKKEKTKAGKIIKTGDGEWYFFFI